MLSIKTTKLCMIAGTLFMLWFLYYLMVSGCLTDTAKMAAFVSRFGSFSFLFFLFLQVLQVIIPILPGGISSGIGILLFGPITGFVLNYIGLMIGSILLFLFVRKYGKAFILTFTDRSTYDKYSKWLEEGKKFERFFAFAIFVPGFPDDLLCMIAALSNMSFEKYVWINALCKPLSLLVYSWGIKEIITYMGSIF